ncbi:MAG: cache domain-containing protein, partial [Candidatus Eisenbacteria bacterium]
MNRLSLRWKILTLTAVPLLALAGATLWFVDRGVTQRSEEALADDLRRAAGVFENMLAASATELEVTGAVVVRDPRFFSVLALPHTRNDAEYRATVAGVAQDFQRLAHPDVFELVDHRGELVTSVGRMRVLPSAREQFVGSVLAGRPERRAISQKGSHVLVVGTPVVADGRVVGALLLGREVSGGLAARLRELTSSQVSFVYERHITRTTLGVGDERDVAKRAAANFVPQADRPVRDGGWIAYARPLPMAAEGTRQLYVLQ